MTRLDAWGRIGWMGLRIEFSGEARGWEGRCGDNFLKHPIPLFLKRVYILTEN